MNIYIYEALTDIEIRLMELLADVKGLREQSYYTYVDSGVSEEDADALDLERFEAFEQMIKHDE